MTPPKKVDVWRAIALGLVVIFVVMFGYEKAWFPGIRQRIAELIAPATPIALPAEQTGDGRPGHDLAPQGDPRTQQQPQGGYGGQQSLEGAPMGRLPNGARCRMMAPYDGQIGYVWASDDQCHRIPPQNYGSTTVANGEMDYPPPPKQKKCIMQGGPHNGEPGFLWQDGRCHNNPR
ncbi:hypothetical protein HZC00_01405 [Candidatus Kaiserbacteria bacterium]|nr:hypothetical protein [Candidatus Kaiserbacteria bacterium]